MSLVIVGFLVNARWLHDWWNFRRLVGASHSTMRSKLHHKESLVNAIDQWLIIDWQSCETQPFAMTPQTLDIDNKDRQVEYKKSAISKFTWDLLKVLCKQSGFMFQYFVHFVYICQTPLTSWWFLIIVREFHIHILSVVAGSSAPRSRGRGTLTTPTTMTATARWRSTKVERWGISHLMRTAWK